MFVKVKRQHAEDVWVETSHIVAVTTGTHSKGIVTVASGMSMEMDELPIDFMRRVGLFHGEPE